MSVEGLARRAYAIVSPRIDSETAGFILGTINAGEPYEALISLVTGAADEHIDLPRDLIAETVRSADNEEDLEALIERYPLMGKVLR